MIRAFGDFVLVWEPRICQDAVAVQGAVGNRITSTLNSMSDPESPLLFAFVIGAATAVAIVLLGVGGYAMWFGLGPGSGNHAGAPYTFWGALLLIVGGLVGLLTARVSRKEGTRGRDRDA